MTDFSLDYALPVPSKIDRTWNENIVSKNIIKLKSIFYSVYAEFRRSEMSGMIFFSTSPYMCHQEYIDYGTKILFIKIQ